MLHDLSALLRRENLITLRLHFFLCTCPDHIWIKVRVCTSGLKGEKERLLSVLCFAWSWKKTLPEGQPHLPNPT